jgi:hypothetical protein
MIGSKYARILILLMLLFSSLCIAEAMQTSVRAQSRVEDSRIKDSRIEQLENRLFWVSIVCALSLMLPLPICIYYYRRVFRMLTEIDHLKTELRDREALKAQLDQLLARNERLETEIKQTGENLRATLRTAEGEHKVVAEKLKEELRLLEVENRRLSGLLILKEQASKRL